ncbi:MAG: site-2 protease family protein [Actinomycetota bacterium]
MAATDAPERTRRGAFPRAVTVLRVRGVPIRLHVSWVLIAALVLWVFWVRFAVLLAPYGTATVALSSALLAVVFFASIIAHELGHAVASLDRGIGVASVTLFLLGGVTESDRAAERARDEALIVAAGPLVSVALAAVFGLAHALAPGATPYGAVTGYAAWLNLLLAVFNVIPAYPLDGGRLLRAVLWGLSGNAHASTRWAARVGQAFAGVLVLGGLNGLLGGPLPTTDGPLRWLVVLLAANGLWGLLIGVFLLRSATDAHRRATARAALAAHDLAEVMGTPPPTLPADLPLRLAAERLAERPSLLWPVGGPGLAGGVRLLDVEGPLAAGGGQRPVSLVAHPPEDIAVDVGAPLDRALDRMLDAPGQMLIVTRGGAPVGLLTTSLVGGLLR